MAQSAWNTVRSSGVRHSDPPHGTTLPATVSPPGAWCPMKSFTNTLLAGFKFPAVSCTTSACTCIKA
eukprot:5530005-Pyramimonas_sp.AAC.2